MRTKVVICVRGGLIQHIHSNDKDIDIWVYDFDREFEPRHGEDPDKSITAQQIEFDQEYFKMTDGLHDVY